MASAALLFSFSAVVFLFVLLQAPPAAAPGLAVADLLASALDRVLLDGRGLVELATRRNMILLCHAILLLILRDAGVLGKPARRRSRRPPGEVTAAASAGTETIACSAVAPARPHATRNDGVVWRRRRPRNRAVVAPVHEHGAAAGRVVDVECRPAAEAAATWAAPVQTTGPAAQAAEEPTKQIVVVESPTPRNDDDDLLDRHDPAAVAEPLEHPAAFAADNGDHRGSITVADDDTAREQPAAGMEMEMELADDRTFEEFIESQRRQMRQESLRLVSSGYHCQAMAACY